MQHTCWSHVPQPLLRAAITRFCCLQYQLNQRILAAAKTRRPMSSYDQLHRQPDSCMSTFAPILYHGP